MKTFEKAPSAGSTMASGKARGLFGLVCLCALGLAALLGSGAPSAGATEACPNEQFRLEQHATYLPDCRAYELVSPVDKNGGDVITNATRIHTAADGDGVAFASLAGFGDVNGLGVAGEYMARRDPATGAWITHGISPLQDATGYFGIVFSQAEPHFLAFSSDLARGVLLIRGSLSEAPNVAAAVNLYARDDLFAPGHGSWQLLTDSTTPQPPSLSEAVGSSFGLWLPSLADSTSDLSHVLFESQRNLTADTTACTESSPDGNCPSLLYESVDGVLRYVGYVPATPGQVFCTGVGPDCAPAPASFAGRGARKGHVTAGTLSRDGSRVVFTTASNPNESRGDLYLRDDQGTASTADDTTTQINASEKAVPDEPKPAEFWAASTGVDAEGDRAPLRVFFTTTESLSEDDTNEGGTDAYMWSEEADGEGHHLTRLSIDSEPADGVSPNVEGFIGASEDGSYAYFVNTNDRLLGTPPTEGEGTIYRIFVWHAGAIHEVGAVHDLDSVLGRVAPPSSKLSRLSPDGTHLAFFTEGSGELLSLYGQPEYDQGNGCPFDGGPQCKEAYVYDATANSANDPVTGDGMLECASCNPSGAPATVDAGPSSTQEGLGAANDSPYLNRFLTDDGRFVFFNTAERLVEEDTNGAIDVYEYDTGTHQVHLLSSGTATTNQYFMDATPDGGDVFIASRDRLRQSDIDQGRDLYDVRVGGGSAEPIPPAVCQPTSDTCQPPPQPLPPATSPQSDRPLAQGNVHQPRCPKGKVRRHGKCVKKKHRQTHGKHKRADNNRRAAR